MALWKAYASLEPDKKHLFSPKYHTACTGNCIVASRDAYFIGSLAERDLPYGYIYGIEGGKNIA